MAAPVVLEVASSPAAGGLTTRCRGWSRRLPMSEAGVWTTEGNGAAEGLTRRRGGARGVATVGLGPINAAPVVLEVAASPEMVVGVNAGRTRANCSAVTSVDGRLPGGHTKVSM